MFLQLHVAYRLACFYKLHYDPAEASGYTGVIMRTVADLAGGVQSWDAVSDNENSSAPV